jgi:hypothetical protein
MHLKFRITQVDHDGFCGRENHPDDSDIGLVVTPVKVLTVVVGDDGEIYEEFPDNDMLKDAARNMTVWMAWRAPAS